MQRNSRFGWLEGDLLIQQNPVTKGDFSGHPFRGNQYGDASGASFLSASESQQRGKMRQVGERKMIRHGTGHYETTNGFHFIQGAPPTRTWSVHTSAEDRLAIYETGESKLSTAVADFERYQTETNQKMIYNDLKFNPYGPESQEHSEQDRRDERIEHSANANLAYQDARSADLMLLHSLRGVGVVEVPSPFAIKGFRYENVIRLGGYDTTMSTKTNNIIHHSRAAAEKQTKKVIAEMEQILSDPTLEVRALDKNMWEYTFNHTLGNGTVRRATTRVTFRKPKDDANVTKGLSCPPATQSIEVNLRNRLEAVDVANYGPMNPDLPNTEFWDAKGKLFKTTAKEAKTARCHNCAAFIQTTEMLNCIETGLDVGEEGKTVIDLANLGYCEIFDFKCAGDRTCDAWVVGGPVTDENLVEKSDNDPRLRMLKTSTESQFTLAPWYIPDKYDAQNEWTDAVELQKALWEYVKGGDREIRLQHNREIRAGEWVEAMTLPYEWSVPVHKANGEVGSHTYPKGTVLLGVVWDDWAWEMVKKGDITGFSIGGSAERIDLEMPT